jgi:hypothetical protein
MKIHPDPIRFPDCYIQIGDVFVQNDGESYMVTSVNPPSKQFALGTSFAWTLDEYVEVRDPKEIRRLKSSPWIGGGGSLFFGVVWTRGHGWLDGFLNQIPPQTQEE